ncbi:MAG: hypothetical protein NZ108_02245 [Bacteroidia bacterium]|nr:hypothetical protein [Bacteroidia bacterium]
MKRMIPIAALASILMKFTWAQSVGIGTALPNPTAILDLSSTSLGFLLPRMSESQKNAIPSPATGLLVYQTNGTPGFYYYDGSQWVLLGGGSGTPGWQLTGNSGTNPGVAIGQHFVGTTDAQDLFVSSNRNPQIQLKPSGAIRLTGDLENQSLQGVVISFGSPLTPSTPPNQTHAALGIPTMTGYCASCTPTYGYQTNLSVFNNSSNTLSTGHVIDGCIQSITIQDGSGSNHSGVLVMANVVVKTTNTGTSANTGRYMIFLQRSTDPSFSTVDNLYKVEDMPSSAASGVNPVAGAATTTLIYPDLNLAPGTYYYRLVFASLLAGSNGQLPSIADRSMVLLQVKQ